MPTKKTKTETPATNDNNIVAQASFSSLPLPLQASLLAIVEHMAAIAADRYVKGLGDQ